jgi:hypothetical protein
VDPDPEPGAVLFNTKSGILNPGWKKIKILDPGSEINIRIIFPIPRAL